MTVREMLAALNGCDPAAHVICWCEDDPSRTQAFEVESAAVRNVVPLQHGDGSVGIRLESGPGSVKWVVIEIISANRPGR